VTEDAAEFAAPSPDDELPAGPGDAPVDVTIDDEPAVSPRAARVEDDPHGGLPIEETAGAPNPDEEGDTAVEETEAADTPVDVSGGVGLEKTLEGHARTEGEVLYTGRDTDAEDANA
jgi:hypothetical protein